MAVVGLAYFAWIMMSPVNIIFGAPFGAIPPMEFIIVNTILYIPLIYYTVRRWLRTMMNRKGGPAAGIDTVEPGDAEPEPGDEWGRATRPYKQDIQTKVGGSKSELRESMYAIDAGFFVRVPDLDTGEAVFDVDDLRAKAMIRSRVSSGGWIKKRVRSRASGSLKAMESLKGGRPSRWRKPIAEVGSLHLSSTILAAITRTGKFIKGKRITIKREDLRETMYTGRTPLSIILVIDVSLSMKGSLFEIRQLIDRIERETRGSKDRVGIVAFKDSGAIEVQAPTTNWNKIYRALARLRISGLTPLAESMMKSLESIKRERMRNKDIEPLVIIISDFAPNIPLAQSVGPGHAKYTPIQDIVKASRLIRKQDVRIATVSVDPEHRKWPKFLKRPYHDALELAAMLRMKKDDRFDIMETIMAVPEFRKTFGAFIIAHASGGHAFLSRELLTADSVLSTMLDECRSKARMRTQNLREVKAYLPK